MQKLCGKERRKRAATRARISNSKAPSSMRKLTSGAWKKAEETKNLRLPKGS